VLYNRKKNIEYEKLADKEKCFPMKFSLSMGDSGAQERWDGVWEKKLFQKLSSSIAGY
jgi:hypothetical protein